MWSIILFIVCSPTIGCIELTDTQGPHKTEAICEKQAIKMVTYTRNMLNAPIKFHYECMKRHNEISQ